MKKALSCVLLFLAGSAFMGGFHGLVARFVLPAPYAGSYVAETVLLLAVGVGVTVAGARLWKRWMAALAAVLVLLGIGGFQTRPVSDDPTLDSLSARAFTIDGAILVAAGVALYLLDRRRQSQAPGASDQDDT
jgi:hypothetical protein